MRFVRPTLVVAGRPVLATLEHKPWAPGGEAPWTAAFPWDGGEVDMADVELAVAPSVTVPLTQAATKPKSKPKAAEPEPPPADDGGLARLDAEARDLRDRLAEERQAALQALTGREDLERARAAAERERDNALAQREEAVQDREAAVRTRRRMEEQRDEAVGRVADLEAQRDDAIAQRDEARTQRDDALLAHGVLQRQIDAFRAQELRTESEPAPPRTATKRRRRPDPAKDEPIGVRIVPAARSMAGDLYRRTGTGPFAASKFDLWAIRALGTVAAVCFILLLVMVLRLVL